MTVAGGDAAAPPDGEWPMGSPNGPAAETDSARVALPPSSAPGRAARLHQEDAGHAGRGFGHRARTSEGFGAMSEEHMGPGVDDFLTEKGMFEEA